MSFPPRPRFSWRLRTRTLPLGPQTLLMGILNLTPDSFSDGGRFLSPPSALIHALRMLDQGADLLDLGGESTRPSSTPISPAEEQARVLPTLRAILAARPAAILSIDTYHAETARLAIQAGAEIVNDVSGHLWDPAMSATCAALACGTILMHTRGRPHQWRTQPPLAPAEVVPLVLADLSARAQAALAAGIPRDAIVLDPGFGFGKLRDENFPLLAHLDQLHTLGFPILAGLSRKSFLTRPPAGASLKPGASAGAPFMQSHRMSGIIQPQAPGAPPSPQATVGIRTPETPGAPFMQSHRMSGVVPITPGPPNLDPETWDPTTIANTAGILAGAHILRVHDIPPARQAATLADRLLTS